MTTSGAPGGPPGPPGNTGGSNKVDQATWDRLLEAYRAEPGNHSRASRHAGVQRRTARRAFEVGYPERPWGRVPIKDVLASEAEIARARMQLEVERDELEEDRALLDAERDREAARQRAVQTRTQEGNLITALRATTMNTLGAAIKTVEGLGTAMSRLGGSLIALAGEEMDIKECEQISLIARRFTATLRDIADAGQTAMEMERLFLGEPTQLVGVVTDLDTAPLDELVKLAGYQDGVLRRAAERGLVVLEGGAGKKSEPGAG